MRKSTNKVMFGMGNARLMDRKDILEMVGAGWDVLLNPLITMCIEENITIEQVKEKFGGLRFYVSGGDEKLHDAIGLVEEQSFHVCELCGAGGRVVKLNSGWLQTRCNTHYSKKEEQR